MFNSRIAPSFFWLFPFCFCMTQKRFVPQALQSLALLYCVRLDTAELPAFLCFLLFAFCFLLFAVCCCMTQKRFVPQALQRIALLYCVRLDTAQLPRHDILHNAAFLNYNM